MKERILSALKSKDDFVSGQELCDELGVSRTAIWKVINQLKSEGYEIESVRNRGYRLMESPDIITAAEIAGHMDTEWFGRKILYFDVTDSTNNEIKRHSESEKEGLLAIAEQQTAGKGRRGRAWESPSGTGIWMSFLLKPDITPTQASMITIVTALATAMAVREVTGLDALIKWPNDIVVNAKKTVGILTEMSTEIDYINYVVVGIGINANTDSFPEDIRDTATSFKIECGHPVKRSLIVAAFGKYFEKYYEDFLKAGNLSLLRKDYDALLVNRDRQVKILDGASEPVMTALGINDEGELVVKDSDGSISTVRAGEVSVRGIYGYV